MHSQWQCIMVMVFGERPHQKGEQINQEITFPTALSLLVSSNSSSSSTANSSESSSSTTVRTSICLLPPVCMHNSPRVCGRFPDGKCQRFNNICHLLEAHHNGKPAAVWHVAVRECRFVAGVGHLYRRPCNDGCPGRRVNCKRTPHSAEICVRTNNQKECQLLANVCQLRHQNCQDTPRHNWHRTDKRRCGAARVSDNPRPCLPLPIREAPKAVTHEQAEHEQQNK
ncbi:uncharacterized protein LOC117581601 isoform X1 [Drosophila guanche]|uniref:Uncharacterized protein n=1 Tax=Drosophila guanche TaxID=7266 RepID=A0A3B0JZ20_DROGU|nr:uncharacterized protein LOC117581601 isoform X1 [Drosophila guanche]SPP78626.1 Hypothetical predicted protein [Drosophila guanche]